MVIKLNRVFIGLSYLILASLACGLRVAPALPPETNNRIDLAVTQTLEALTAQAFISPAGAGFTETPIVFTLPPDPAFTITDIPIPTATSTITFTPSPTVPIVHVSTATFCRTGPGTAYEIVTTAEVGNYYVIVGRDTFDNYWIINLPGGGQCWLWGKYAIVEGSVAGLQEISPPPTPKPLLGYIIVTVTGPITTGSDASITNGTVEIRSLRVVAENQGGGAYKFSNIPPGSWEVVANAPSYKYGYGTVELAGNQTLQINIRLLWESNKLNGCAALPTIQERIKCYQGINVLPTSAPPVLP